MHKYNHIVTALLIGVSFIAAPASAAEFINFETKADGSATSSNQSVGTDFSAIGVTFFNAFYKQCGGGCPSPTNGIFVSSSNFSSPFTVNFAGITNSFSFANVSNSSGTARAFGLNGDLLQEINFSNFPGTFSFSTTNIKSVSFSSTSQFGVDNFNFDGVQSAVPEPATWAMMLLGFGLIGGAMRSAKRRQKLTVSFA